MAQPNKVASSDEFNQRILEKLAKSRWQRFEGASIKTRIVLRSPDAKRLYAREFNWLQMNEKWMDRIACEQFPPSVCELVDNAIRLKITRCLDVTEQAIACFLKESARHQINYLVAYPDEPIATSACVACATGADYLALLQKIDALMHMVDTLAILKKITNKQRAVCKGHIRWQATQIAHAIRAWKMELAQIKTAEDHTQWPRDLRGPDARGCERDAARTRAFLHFLATLQGAPS
ncbi:MAG TPA: hypothetical protein VIF82_18280 [Burkholderiaceae bacterium]